MNDGRVRLVEFLRWLTAPESPPPESRAASPARATPGERSFPGWLLGNDPPDPAPKAAAVPPPAGPGFWAWLLRPERPGTASPGPRPGGPGFFSWLFLPENPDRAGDRPRPGASDPQRRGGHETR